MTHQRLRDAILIVLVSAALIATGWAFYGLGRQLPPPPQIEQPTVPDRPTPDELTAPGGQFTYRSSLRH